MHRFACFNQRREMHYGLNVMLFERRTELLSIKNVTDYKRRGRLDCNSMSFRQIVKHNYLVPRNDQLGDSDTAYVSCAAGDEHVHESAFDSVQRLRFACELSIVPAPSAAAVT